MSIDRDVVQWGCLVGASFFAFLNMLTYLLCAVFNLHRKRATIDYQGLAGRWALVAAFLTGAVICDYV